MTRVLTLASALLAISVLPVAEARGASAEEVGAHAEEVVVTSRTAPVKVKDRMIGNVAEGDRFEVLDRQAGWVPIAITTDQGTRRGWVLANHVQT